MPIKTANYKNKNKNVKKDGKEEEEEDDGSLTTFILTQLNKFFVDHLPVDNLKQLPPKC